MDPDPLAVVERTLATRLLERRAELHSTIVDCEPTERQQMDAQEGHLRAHALAVLHAYSVNVYLVQVRLSCHEALGLRIGIEFTGRDTEDHTWRKPKGIHACC